MDKKKIPVKRVGIVSLKLVKEHSVLYETRTIRSPYDAYKLIKNFLIDSDREKFVVACLDTKNQPVNISVVSIGSVNSAIVHPREVFHEAIKNSSASIIIAHNHPSGDPTPSKEDINITKRLKECGELLGIKVLDHIIIGKNAYVSLKEKGIL